jgi:general secretion pathway protein J
MLFILHLRINSMPSQSRATQGFTLIELLVAMAILGILLAVVYSGLSVALTMWGSAGRRAEAFEETQTAVEILRGQIKGAVPLLQVSEAQQSTAPLRLAFYGNSNSLRFVSGSSWRDGAQGTLRWVELKAQADRLNVDERPILPPANAPGPASLWHAELPLFEDVHFRYLRRAQPDREAEWRDSWDSVELRELPRAVGVRYSVKGRMESLTIPLDYAEANSKGYQVQ